MKRTVRKIVTNEASTDAPFRQVFRRQGCEPERMQEC